MLNRFFLCGKMPRKYYCAQTGLEPSRKKGIPDRINDINNIKREDIPPHRK